MFKGEIYNLQIIKCGAISALAGAVFLFVFYCGGNVWRFCDMTITSFVEIMSANPWVVGFFETVGSSHFSIHVAVLSVYAWSQCVYWKLGAYNPVESIRLKFYVYTSVASYLALLFLLSGISYQPEAISAIETMMAIVVFTTSAFSVCGFIGYTKPESTPDSDDTASI